jgi:hypothetical protein
MEYTNQERLKTPSERYIHFLVLTTEIRLAITANIILLGRIHFTQVLACDFSFKRTLGDFDEWKVVGWDVQLQRRKSRSLSHACKCSQISPMNSPGVTYLTGYCDRSTTEAFTVLFREMLRVVEEVTGTPLCFKRFWPADAKDISEARLFGVLLDAEIAQVRGLAATLPQYVTTYNPKAESLPKEPMDLAMMVIKFCVLHYARCARSVHPLGRRYLATSMDSETWISLRSCHARN